MTEQSKPTTTRKFILEVTVIDDGPTDPNGVADELLEAVHAAADLLPDWIYTINGCDPDPDWLYAGRSLAPAQTVETTNAVGGKERWEWVSERGVYRFLGYVAADGSLIAAAVETSA